MTWVTVNRPRRSNESQYKADFEIVNSFDCAKISSMELDTLKEKPGGFTHKTLIYFGSGRCEVVLFWADREYAEKAMTSLLYLSNGCFFHGDAIKQLVTLDEYGTVQLKHTPGLFEDDETKLTYLRGVL